MLVGVSFVTCRKCACAFSRKVDQRNLGDGNGLRLRGPSKSTRQDSKEQSHLPEGNYCAGSVFYT